MENLPQQHSIYPWIEADLSLAGMMDRRMMALLQAIDETGSINQAAKQQGLSYKGAWQIIERANNSAPRMLISTAVGGSKGGGTRLTEDGRKLLDLFNDLQRQHQAFIDQLNHQLSTQADVALLLQRMAVKCSSRNQLFGRIAAIRHGAVNAEVLVTLNNRIDIAVDVGIAELEQMAIAVGADALLLIESSAVVIVAQEAERWRFSSRNCLSCRVLRIQQDAVEAEVLAMLDGGEILGISVTRASLENMALQEGQAIQVVFKRNAAILGVI